MAEATVAHGGRVNEAVMQDLPELLTQAPAGEATDSVQDAFSPSSRMAAVEKGGTAYAREYRLTLLHRLLLRRVPLDQIASELDVSVSTVKRDRTLLYDALKKEASSLDINSMIGETLSFYSEVTGMALRAASNSRQPMNVRLAALRTALSSKNDSHRFLNVSGVYDVLQFKQQETTATDDISALMGLTKKLLTSDAEDVDSLMADMGIEGIGKLVDEDDDLRLLS